MWHHALEVGAAEDASVSHGSQHYSCITGCSNEAWASCYLLAAVDCRPNLNACVYMQQAYPPQAAVELPRALIAD